MATIGNFGFDMICVLNDIGWHAKKHHITPEQVRRCFEVGTVAATQFGIIPPQIENADNNFSQAPKPKTSASGHAVSD